MSGKDKKNTDGGQDAPLDPKALFPISAGYDASKKAGAPAGPSSHEAAAFSLLEQIKTLDILPSDPQFKEVEKALAKAVNIVLYHDPGPSDNGLKNVVAVLDSDNIKVRMLTIEALSGAVARMRMDSRQTEMVAWAIVAKSKGPIMSAEEDDSTSPLEAPAMCAMENIGFYYPDIAAQVIGKMRHDIGSGLFIRSLEHGIARSRIESIKKLSSQLPDIKP